MPKKQMSKNCKTETTGCRKCGRTWYVKGNNTNLIRKRVKMILRLHGKKCKGTKKLSEDEVDKIVCKESLIHSASLRSYTILTKAERAKNIHDDGSWEDIPVSLAYGPTRSPL